VRRRLGTWGSIEHRYTPDASWVSRTTSRTAINYMTWRLIMSKVSV